MRWVIVVAVAAASLVAAAGTAAAIERPASMGNFWYEEDTQRDRARIIVDQGDTLTFVVREYEPPSHTVDVDELNVHSPDLILLDSWTTPPLDTPGTFRLYCRPHGDRGHVTTLIVRPKASAGGSSTPAPAAGGGTGRPADEPRTGAPPDVPAEPTASPDVVEGDAPAAAPAVDGPTDPDALAADLAARYPVPEPWTRSVRLFVLAVPPIVAAAAVALWLDARRRTLTLVVPTPAPPKPRPRTPKAAGGARPAARRTRAAAKRSPPGERTKQEGRGTRRSPEEP